MENQLYSGSTRGNFGDGPPRLTQKERKTMNAPDTANEQGRHSTTESKFAEGGSQLVDNKRRRKNKGSPRAGNAEYADEAGPETIDEETIPRKTIENQIQQRLEKMNDVSSQVMEVVLKRELNVTSTFTTFEEEILKLQDELKSIKNADIGDEEINIVLLEARGIFKKLQPSAWATSHEQDGDGGSSTSGGRGLLQ